jgi:hypothetical protein
LYQFESDSPSKNNIPSAQQQRKEKEDSSDSDDEKKDGKDPATDAPAAAPDLLS